jgi:hypothetical protein
MMAKNKTVFSIIAFCALLSAGCISMPFGSSSKIPLTRKGEMSTVVLFHVERRNYIHEGERTYTYPDGLVFYFIVYPVDKNNSYPTIKESQNFTINGQSYWQNANGSIDSHTVIYNERTFKENEPGIFAKAGIKLNSGVLIQKTVICGDPLPEQGAVRYLFYFGFAQELEEFDFQFKIQDLL